MKPIFKPLLLSGLMAVALTSLAQPGPAPEGARPELRERFQERVQRHLARRQADLKAKLQLNTEQESAWASYVAAMKPPVGQARPNRADFEKLTTPERLDKLHELRKQREAEFEQRDAATRTFYAALGTEQKKIFDANTARPFHEGRPRGQR